MKIFLNMLLVIKSLIFDLFLIFYPTKLFDLYSNGYSVKKRKKYNHYAAQMLFGYKFDSEKLRQKIIEVSKLFDIDESEIYFSNKKDSSLNFYDSNEMELDSNHYIYKDDENYSFKKDSAKFSDYKLAIESWYNESDNSEKEVTLMWLYLPGKPWDGTSCFNFMKEIINRYFDKRNDFICCGYNYCWNNNIKNNLNNWFYVIRHAILSPINVYYNNIISDKQIKLSKDSNKYNNDREMCFLNLSKEYTSKLVSKVKKIQIDNEKGVPPMAVILYAIILSYYRNLNEFPKGIIVQASLLSYCFDTNKSNIPNRINNRYFVGDWLIGVFYEIREKLKKNGSEVSLLFMKKLYQNLHHELKTGTGSVRDSFLARTYSINKGDGLVDFQKSETYTGENYLNDSLMFNNYGLRYMDERSNPICWNWTGPGKLNCNCLSINDQTCMTFASTLLSINEIKKIRSDVKEILDSYID